MIWLPAGTLDDGRLTRVYTAEVGPDRTVNDKKAKEELPPPMATTSVPLLYEMVRLYLPTTPGAAVHASAKIPEPSATAEEADAKVCDDDWEALEM